MVTLVGWRHGRCFGAALMVMLSALTVLRGTLHSIQLHDGQLDPFQVCL